ncbi:antibiotic biosynthesis monooxygenase family protein [Actinoplanes sp. NPDC051513]|uniref:antibiotic biosynthesis monooxygenase family protein n=1 Tax=Actinoplanes sp. NPDC051513 TaxID=3363908 RepID=UPI0037B93B05
MVQPVTWINIFEVPADRAEEFSAIWRDVFAPHFSAKPGFVSYRMHQATSPDARFRFVNVTLWESAEHIAAAHDERFRELLSHPALNEITAHPGIYEVISEG